MKLNGKIIAHRGIFDNELVPENSIPAFKKAIKENIPIELDVQLTKDNVLVVFHDDNLYRMTGKDINIQKVKYDEIKNIKLLNTNEVIPTFEEVLKLVDNKVLLNIEIKSNRRIKDVCTILMEHLHYYWNFVLQSFNPFMLRYIKNNYFSIEVGLLVKNEYPGFISDLFYKSKFIIKYSKTDFLSISKKLLKNKKFSKLTKFYPTLLWTIKKDEEVNYNDEFIYICNNLPFKK
jgi:glycerophosphoryl diester phosphodiesterase